MSTVSIEVRDIKKSFNLKPILRGIDLTLQHGERVALLGANGAGKTTLLRILAGLSKPDAGIVRINGVDVVCDAQHARRLSGYVAHQPYLYDELTVLENLLFFGRMYTVKNTRARAYELLGKVGLERLAQEYVRILSRGQVQRLAIARSLLHSPAFLLLDEVHTGLDQEGQRRVKILLDEHMTNGRSILFTTHQQHLASELSNRILTLDKGRIIDG